MKPHTVRDERIRRRIDSLVSLLEERDGVGQFGPDCAGQADTRWDTTLIEVDLPCTVILRGRQHEIAGNRNEDLVHVDTGRVEVNVGSA